MKCLPHPCPTCPWRVDSHADTIPGFQIELAEELASTACDPTAGLEGAIFACHQSRPNDEFPCAGWLAVHGYGSVRVRILASTGDIPPALVGNIPDDWPALHSSYDEVIAKLRDDVSNERGGTSAHSKESGDRAPASDHGAGQGRQVAR